MGRHAWIWTVALALLASAWALSALKRGSAVTEPADYSARIETALALVREDEALLHRDAQRAVRALSVLAESGEITSAEGAYILALQFKRERNFDGAEAQYRRAMALRPDWSWPYHGLGYLLGQHTHGRVEEAIGYLQRAIELDPEWGRPHNSLAVLYRIIGRTGDAETEARLALELEPEDFASLNNYANLLKEQNRFEEAESYYQMAIANMPDHPKPHYNLACLYSQQGKVNDALQELQKAFNLADVLRVEAVSDPDLDPLRDQEAFRAMLRP